MFIDTWIVFTAPPVIAAVGFLVCAMFTAGKASDDNDWEAVAIDQAARAAQSDEAHARCSDSRNTLLARIDRLKSIALSQQSVKSGRIVAVLEGEA